MAPKLIPFPTRNPAYTPQWSHDSLARDTQASCTQRQASRIAAQVEQEIARQAERYATGNRHSRASHKVLVMPSVPTLAKARGKGRQGWLRSARAAAIAAVGSLFSF